MTHTPYWNAILAADYCEQDGEEWPCLHVRTVNPRCLCSHAMSVHQDGDGECWSAACGCSYFRPKSETRTA